MATAAIVSVVAWLALEVRGLAQRPAPPSTSAPEPAPPATGKRRYKLSAKPSAPPVVTYQEFNEIWEAGPDDEAEEKCFAPLAKSGVAPEAAPHFFIAVDPTGAMKDVRYAALPAHAANQKPMYDCIVEIVRTLKLKPSPTGRRGEVQATRPGGVVVATPTARPAPSR